MKFLQNAILALSAAFGGGQRKQNWGYTLYPYKTGVGSSVLQAQYVRPQYSSELDLFQYPRYYSPSVLNIRKRSIKCVFQKFIMTRKGYVKAVPDFLLLAFGLHTLDFPLTT